jgi:hypothetical protein
MTLRLLTASLLSLSAVSAASAQVPSPRGAVPAARATALANSTALDTAVEYQIGPEDVLDISVWKNPELSRTVPVRPDEGLAAAAQRLSSRRPHAERPSRTVGRAPLGFRADAGSVGDRSRGSQPQDRRGRRGQDGRTLRAPRAR